MSSMLDKMKLRRHMYHVRTELTDEMCHQATKSITNHFLQSQLFKQSQHIAVYHAVANEVDTHLVVERIWQSDKTCYLPVLSESSQRTVPQLCFAHYTSQTELQKNCYGINEPIEAEYCSWQVLDIVLVPLLAFDADAYRLGMGKGYYDATFADLLEPQNGSVKKAPYLLGLAYAFQEVAFLPRDQWDIQLRGILTEKSWIEP